MDLSRGVETKQEQYKTSVHNQGFPLLALERRLHLLEPV